MQETQISTAINTATTAATTPAAAKPLITRRLLLCVWVALVTLTLVGPALAGAQLSASGIAALVLLLAAAKFLLISFYFMELATAHFAWRALSVLYVGIVALVIWLTA